MMDRGRRARRAREAVREAESRGDGACGDPPPSATVDRILARWSTFRVLLPRAPSWISILVVAIAVALAVPVAQLRLVSVLHACCCPDPDDCRCPDHRRESSPEPTVLACHGTEQAVMAPQLPAFHAPVASAAVAPAQVVAQAQRALPLPHEAPPPQRPDAPS